MDSPWKTERQAAEYLGLHKDTLRKRRKQGNAPPSKRVGQRYFYNVADLKRYMKRLGQRDAAAYLGVHYETLALWNRQGVGPKCRKVGGLFIYERADLDKFTRTA
jgi:DNA-binding transcriptional MerR regulator